MQFQPDSPTFTYRQTTQTKPKQKKDNMNDQNRIYHVVTHLSTRRPFYAFTGKNAKRDAIRLAQRTGGKAKVMTGEEWKDAREL